jgi:lauroyl/myristoyl acyltransferase
MTDPNSSPKLPFALASDARHIATFGLAACVVRTVRETRWRGVAERFARASSPVRPRRGRSDFEGQLKLVRELVRSDAEALEVMRGTVASMFEEKLFFHKARAHPDWRPPMRLEGAERLRTALEQGRGAMVWVSPVTFATLVVKMALSDAGFRLLHLSRDTHGGGRSRLGRRLNNEFQNPVEERFAERLVMPAAGASPSAIKALTRGLRQGAVASISAIHSADKPLRLPFLGGTISLAAGAPRLAARHGAPLFAVTLVRDADDGFTTRIEPLEAQGLSGEALVLAQATAFATLYEASLRQSPTLLRRSIAMLSPEPPAPCPGPPEAPHGEGSVHRGDAKGSAAP